MALHKNLPNTPVHDLVVHPKAKEIVVGTHGRSIFKASVKELQQLDAETLAKPLALFDIPSIRYHGGWGATRGAWGELRQPEVLIPVYAKESGKATLKLLAGDNILLYEWSADLKKGLNYLPYNLEWNERVKGPYEKYLNEQKKPDADAIVLEKAKNGKWYLRKGSYVLKVEAGGSKVEGKLVVE